MSYLLDTNVVSELSKAKADPKLLVWFASVKSHELYLSVLVLGEIRQGIERLRGRDPGQAQVYENWLATLERDFSDRILAIDNQVADVWGSLNARDPLPVVDGLLAATALVHDLRFVTRNVSDVARTGVKLLNPFA